MCFQAKVVLPFLLLTTVSSVTGSVRSRSVIDEKVSSYSCCDRSIKFNQPCDKIFKMGDKNFARVYQDVNKCISPCKTIQDGRMILDACVNVTVTIVCTDMLGTTKETQITYLCQKCPQPRVNRMSPVLGSMALLPVVVIWITSFIFEVI